MTPFEAIILGIVQGATEFLPVSSSGHLLIARKFLNLPLEHSLSFDAILQFATVLALVIYFWNDIWNILKSIIKMIKREFVDPKDKVLVGAIVVGTIPAIFFGLFLESYMDTFFRSITLVSTTLILGSILMYVSQVIGKQDKRLSLNRGFIIGFFQSLALIPGVSRSGATISGGLLMGLSRIEAVRFSFLLSIPILLGSGFKKILEMDIFNSSLPLTSLWIGSITSFLVGLFVIHYFIRFMKNHNLTVFIIYRIVLAFLLFLIF